MFYDSRCWATVLDNDNSYGIETTSSMATEPLDWPVLYASGI
jgi:hypothetical protein